MTSASLDSSLCSRIMIWTLVSHLSNATLCSSEHRIVCGLSLYTISHVYHSIDLQPLRNLCRLLDCLDDWCLAVSHNWDVRFPFCGGVDFRRSAILPWIFAVDSWTRGHRTGFGGGQHVWVRRRGTTVTGDGWEREFVLVFIVLWGERAKGEIWRVDDWPILATQLKLEPISSLSHALQFLGNLSRDFLGRVYSSPTQVSPLIRLL